MDRVIHCTVECANTIIGKTKLNRNESPHSSKLLCGPRWIDAGNALNGACLNYDLSPAIDYNTNKPYKVNCPKCVEEMKKMGI